MLVGRFSLAIQAATKLAFARPDAGSLGRALHLSRSTVRRVLLAGARFNSLVVAERPSATFEGSATQSQEGMLPDRWEPGWRVL